MPRSSANSKITLWNESATALAIADIRVLQRDPNQRRIVVGRKIVATLPAHEVERLGLRVGSSWNDQTQHAVRHTMECAKARAAILRLLGARERSRSELTQRLERRGFPAEVINATLDQAARDGWIDEQRLAAEVVRGVTARKPAGRALIEQAMQRRGVSGPAARDALEQGSGDDFEAARVLARKRLTGLSAVAPATVLRRIAGLLARRGFDDDTVERVIEHLRPIVECRDDAE